MMPTKLMNRMLTRLRLLGLSSAGNMMLAAGAATVNGARSSASWLAEMPNESSARGLMSMSEFSLSSSLAPYPRLRTRSSS